MNKPLDPTELGVAASLGDNFERFIHLVSHDVRASAQALTDLPEWIVEDIAAAGLKLPEAAAQSLDLLVRHSKRLDRMMEDLLVYSTVGQAQAVIRVDPARVLSDILGAGEFDGDWEINLDMVPCLVEIGERDVRTLFRALISNAIKHTGQLPGAMNISCTVAAGQVTMQFSDNGPGIEAQFQRKIFEVMTTLKPRDSVEGSGLGLAISKRICERYGGRIWVESKPSNEGLNGGSVFGVTLPLAV